jgi:glycosyltransferase involved in cell wall biosynthesis
LAIQPPTRVNSSAPTAERRALSFHPTIFPDERVQDAMAKIEALLHLKVILLVGAVGAFPRLLDLQQQADVLCLPTYGDTNPWVLLEAMACGTPVVSTRVGGIPDPLEEGHAGVLAPYEDPRALGDAMRALLSDSPRRALLAARARERCEEHYDARRQFSRLIGYLGEITQDLPGSADRQSSAPSTRAAAPE